MAYLIFNNNNCILKIAASDAHRDSLNMILSRHIVKDISDSDFLKIKLGLANISFDGSDVTITDVASSIQDEDSLKIQLKDKIKFIARFIDLNEGHLLYNEIQQYQNYLKDFDTSSLTFPLAKSWEQYCNENSITFFHPLQIP